jgi:hypothetical protein
MSLLARPLSMAAGDCNRGFTVKRMHRAAGFAVAIGVGLTAAEAHASSVTVTFGDLPNAVQIKNYYNGALSGPPIRGPGPDLGLVFSTLANEQKATTTNPPPRPGTGKFENNPSGASGVLFFPFSAADSYVDDAAGFTSLTFTYSLLNNALPPATTYEVDLYSGLNGTGTLLGSIDLTPSATPIACVRRFDEFCTWSVASVFTTDGQFAESAVFAGPSTVLNAEFDRLTFATPEPQSWAMLLIGFASLGLLRLRPLSKLSLRKTPA